MAAAVAPPIEANENPAGSKEEVNFRQGSLSKWMAGLKEALPNPALGQGGEPDPDQETEPPADTPATPAEKPATPPAPATTPPTKPAEAPSKPADAAQPAAEERWPRSAKEWKNFTQSRKAKDEQYEKTIADRDAKIKDLESKASQPVSPEVQKEIEILRKENDDFSKQLRLVAVTNHPRFRSYFESKTNAALSQLRGCVPAERLDTVTKLVQQPDSDAKNDQINELLGELTPVQQGRLFGVINNLSAIQAEKDSEIERARTDYDQMMAQSKAQQEQQRAGFTKLLDDTVKLMQDAKGGRPEYQMRDGEVEWNQSVQRRIDAGKALIAGNLAPEVMFKAALDAAAYPDVLLATGRHWPRWRSCRSRLLR